MTDKQTEFVSILRALYEDVEVTERGKTVYVEWTFFSRKGQGRKATEIFPDGRLKQIA